MDELFHFDCNATFGPHRGKHPQQRWTFQHLIEDMDLAGVAAALVTYSQSLLYDPMNANRKLLEIIKDQRKRVFPCWVAIPNLSGDFVAPKQFVQEVVQSDVRALRLEPDRFGIPVRLPLWRELRDALRDQDVLLVTSMDQTDGHLESVERLLDIFGDHPILLLNRHWIDWRRIDYLMATFPNLHIEFSSFQANRAIEYIARKYGIARCLFGSGMLEKSPGAARGFLDWSLKPREEVAQVAGGNLKRLLGVRGEEIKAGSCQWRDAVTETAMRGHPVPCPTLDAHCHILHDGANTAGGQYVMLKGDADGMIELKRRAGIDRTAIMSWAGPICCDTDHGNRIVEQAVRRYPQHFIGVATVNPDHDSSDVIEEVIQKYLVELGFPGLKTYYGTGRIRYDDPLLDQWYGHANAHGLYAVIDDGGRADDQELDNLATKFPEMGIHLDHCGRSWWYAEWAVSVMKRHMNVWAQINYTAVSNGTIEYLVDQVGADRVLFGTDAPMRDPRPQLGWVVYTRLTLAEKKKILGENFARILREIEDRRLKTED